jgi:predicted nuclease of predicted toxin-antitoxin system
MKLLLDQNISFRIIKMIESGLPDIHHVRDLDLTNFPDFQIFQFARAHGYDAILTLDEDFYNIQLEHGVPPKVIWLRTGNCSTRFLADTILQNIGKIHSFLVDESHDCLEIFR